MAKYLKDIGFRTQPLLDEESFTLAPGLNFLEMLYMDCLPRLQTQGVSKVVVRPCVSLEEPTLETLVHPDVIQISHPFDFGAYKSAGREARKLMALNLLQEAMLTVAQARGWDPAPLEEAYRNVLQRGLIYRGAWTKPVLSPDKKSKVQVWCTVDSNEATVQIAHLKRAVIVAEYLVTRVKPGIVWINEAVGTLKWHSAKTASLTSRDGSKVWTVAVANLEPLDGGTVDETK